MIHTTKKNISPKILLMGVAIIALSVLGTHVADAMKPMKKPTETTLSSSDNEAEELSVKDIDEEKDLPAYADGAHVLTGEIKTYIVSEEDTFLDIARHYKLGYVELRAVNPDVDPWAPVPGTEIIIPTQNIIPRAPQKGIVVNLGKMRLYYFKTAGAKPISYPLGIGREGLATPTGATKIVRKAAHPSWFPTARMREENPKLPVSVPPGNSNPLGTHALYLGWPTFLIHGSNKPWGIGRRVSSGCMRMYPENIISLFKSVPVGTPVTVVDQPVLIGWHDNRLYLEVNPTKTQSQALEYDMDVEEKEITYKQKQMIVDVAGDDANRIDWYDVKKAFRDRTGSPIVIATRSGGHHEKVSEAVKDVKVEAKTKTTYRHKASSYNN